MQRNVRSPDELPPLALLAGGLATRLRPMTETIPKSMVLVAGEPFIAHQLRQIRAEGVRHVVVCAGYLGEQICRYVDDGAAFDVSVEYSMDGPDLLGTGGALIKALPRLGEEFFVMYGDSYLPTRFLPIVEHFRATGRLALMTVYHNANMWDRSNVAFHDGEIHRYDKRNRTADMSYIDYGLGMFRAAAFAAYRDGQPIDLADIYGDLLATGNLAGFAVDQRFYEIGSHGGLREVSAMLSERAFLS